MRRYIYRVVWQDKGKGYDREETGSVVASSARSAFGQVLSPTAKRRRKNWREPEEARITVSITVGPTENGGQSE